MKKSTHHSSSFLILFLSSRKAVKEAPADFPQKNKGFISYVACRNWAVSNPAGTMLDSSSLVNKDHQRMMVDPMFMIVQSLRSFPTAATTTAVAPTEVILPVFT